MSPETWYLLIHRIPARPLYVRARIRNLLLRAGAVALKKSVYSLPKREGALERLQAVAQEIRRGGGDRKSTRLNSSHSRASRMPSSA